MNTWQYSNNPNDLRSEEIISNGKPEKKKNIDLMNRTNMSANPAKAML